MRTGIKTQWLAVVGVVWVLAVSVGCQAVSPGVSYNLGKLEALIASSPEEVTGAAKSVVEEMKLILVSSESTGLDGKVVARTAQSKKVEINIKRQNLDVTHIAIRVGALGDAQDSLLILEKIKGRLEQSAVGLNTSPRQWP